MAGIESFSSWIEATSLSLTIQSTSWVIPATQSVHIVALAIIMASMAMLDFRLIGLQRRQQSLRVAGQRFLPGIWLLLPLSALTGVILIIGEPRRELLSPYFWAKMLMLATVIILTLAARALLEDKPLAEVAPGKRLLLRAAGVASLTLWLAIVFCGRWIAYG